MPSDSPQPGQKWQDQPPRPPRFGGGGVFVVVFLSIAACIGLVVLLANERQNLKAMTRWLGVDHYLAALHEAPRPPQPLKSQRNLSPTVILPDHFIREPDIGVVGVFVREMRDLGPAFCAAFDSSGINNEGWKASQVDRSTFECLSEDLVRPIGGDEPTASFFFIAKGQPDGEINSIRMKLIAPDTDAGRASHDKLVNAVSTLIHETGWSDLAQLLDSTRKLSDYTTIRFGMSYKFTKEFTGEDRYNLIILPINKDPLVKRAREYFDRSNWLPVPSLSGQMMRLPRATAS
ncbi:DUF6030 family protein [Ciceribacter sp. L1K22]|uniref:DUF6030 family protein n=1 Tax=Ciceribacter sp. L1K22 TaxID=2820275 RepID=UPI001ABDD672|nr:DUF6030 family protein [Ciceribacter sp. L1K22]MBO3758430.1 hypothetical protein [Ciceribacter sp. L1K22]